MSLSIDLRMLEHSGIGTYLKNLVPLVTEAFPKMIFNLLGDANCINKYDWCSSANIRVIHCQSPIYTVSEQIELLTKIPADNKLFWSPHFNIPVFYRGKLVVTIHDVFHLAMPQFVKGIHKKGYAKSMFWWIRRNADAVICDSVFTQKELIRYAGINANVVYLGINPRWFSIKREQKVHYRKYLLYVGNVKPHKNLVNLLLAYNIIKDRIPEYDLIIVGKKDGFITGDAEIEKMTKHLEGRVIFTGYVNDNMLCQYYVNAEVLIFPSLYEGFGLPPLEAMACCCPTIVSEAAALPEVCGDAAMYFNPYSCEDISKKILMLISKNDMKNVLKAKGLTQASKFTWEKCAFETCSVIEKVIKQ